MLRIISLGAGVQSTTMALMAARGEIGPMPDAAIFADTGWEPKAVYVHLDRLEKALPFPVHRVTHGNILDHIRRNKNKSGQRFASVPWFTSNGGMGRRQCTREFKIEPLQNKQRELLGYKPRQRIPDGACEVWIGISKDEALRMRSANVNWQTNRWPLIELDMRRGQCIEWLVVNGWPDVPKSSCIGCPYHSDQQWRDLREKSPDEWQQAIDVDRQLRNGGTNRGMRFHQYMHRSMKPLDEVDLRSDAELGQLDLFLNECEGMCGV